VATFSYNGDGFRVQKQDSSGTTRQVWDGQNILLETDGSNTIQVVYTLRPEAYGDLISQSRAGASSFYLFDALGSTRALASTAGTITDEYTYDSFGNTINVVGSTISSYMYTGRSGYYFDSVSSFYYIRVRMYGPQVGRFLSRDPLGFGGGDMNFYRYVGNSPVDLIDPSGAQGWEEILLWCGVLAAAGLISGCGGQTTPADLCREACTKVRNDPALRGKLNITPDVGAVQLCIPGIAPLQCACIVNKDLLLEPKVIKDCILDHELAHANLGHSPCTSPCVELERPNRAPGVTLVKSECEASAAAIACLLAAYTNPANAGNRAEIGRFIRLEGSNCKKLGDDVRNYLDPATLQLLNKWINGTL
jgi:RHS repeat-associated protein